MKIVLAIAARASLVGIRVFLKGTPAALLEEALVGVNRITLYAPSCLIAVT